MTPDEAFDYCEDVEALGVPLTFSRRHYHFALAIVRGDDMTPEEQAYAVFWVAKHDEHEIGAARKRWREDRDGVYDEIERIPHDYDIPPGGHRATELAAAVAGLWDSVESSADEVAQEGEGDSDGPGKSQVTPSTSQPSAA